MNFQDIIREVYDGTNKALKTTGSFSASLGGNVTLNSSPNHIGSVSIFGEVAVAGQATVTLLGSVAHIGSVSIFGEVAVAGQETITPLQAWPDPKTYIGLVTVGNTVSAAQSGTWTVTQASAARTITGNVTLDDGSLVGLVAGVNSIGFATVTPTTTVRSVVGNLTLSDSKGFIGLTTVVQASAARSIVGNVTLDDGSLVGLVAGLNSVGFATVHLGTPTIFAVVNTGAAGVQNSMVTVNAGPNQIGSVTVSNPVTSVALNAGVNGIGFATVHQGGTWTVTQASAARTITGNLTLSDSKGYIGLVTVTQASSSRSILGNLTLSDSKTFIGLVTVVQASSARTITGNLTLSDSKGFVGLVTVVQSSAVRSLVGNLTVSISGTSKTLIPMPFAFAGTSVATVAVPTNTFKVTQLLASANATVGVSIKSGATYLVGNASIRVTVFPGGGWVESGSPISPVYVGLAGAAAIVMEKDNATAAVAGKVIYFDE